MHDPAINQVLMKVDQTECDIMNSYIDEFVQEGRNSNALAME